MTGFIYAMTAGNIVKIGYSRHPRRRNLQVRRDAPSASLIGARPGTIDDERAFHRAHRGMQVLGEWYPITGAIVDFICGMEPAVPEPIGLLELRVWRKANRLTLCAAGALLKCSHSLVSQWETGRVRVADTRLIHVARVTGIPREVLRPDIFAPEKAS